MPRKILSLLLCLLLLIPVTAACSDQADNTQNQVDDASSETEAEETEISDDIPELKFDGYQFRVSTIAEEDIAVEEQDGEVLNDAVYVRNKAVEERFDIVIEAQYHSNYSEVTSELKNTVAAGSDELDMVLIHMVEGAGIASSGYYYPINEIPYINTTKPWWDKDVSNGFRIGGKLFLSSGDIVPTSLLRTSCMVFNKSLFDDYNMTYPYQLAYDNAWTLDELNALTKGMTKDLNGDGKIAFKDDFYGLTNWYLDSPYSFYYGAGGTIVAKDDDDIPYLNLDVEKNIAIFNKIYEIVVTNESYYCTDMSSYESSYSTFYDGRALFCEIALTHLKGDKWRNMEQDYGILPIPKFDVQQKNYLSFVNGCVAMMGIPITITDPERTGAVIEALAATAYKQVTPKLYEVVAKTKHTRDVESSDMIDIIIRNRAFDIGYSHLYSNGITSFVRDLLAQKKTDVASLFAKNEKSVIKSLDKIVTSYEENT